MDTASCPDLLPTSHVPSHFTKGCGWVLVVAVHVVSSCRSIHVRAVFCFYIDCTWWAVQPVRDFGQAELLIAQITYLLWTLQWLACRVYYASLFLLNTRKNILHLLILQDYYPILTWSGKKMRLEHIFYICLELSLVFHICCSEHRHNGKCPFLLFRTTSAYRETDSHIFVQPDMA